MLVWITQLGISVAAPLAGFTLLGLWLKGRFALGIWVVLVCLALGVICAVQGLRSSLKLMEKLDQQNAEKKKSPAPLSFNEHE